MFSLGPLPFNFFINDINKASPKFYAILFADNTNLTCTVCSFDVDIDNDYNMLQLSNNVNNESKYAIQIWLEIYQL